MPSLPTSPSSSLTLSSSLTPAAGPPGSRRRLSFAQTSGHFSAGHRSDDASASSSPIGLGLNTNKQAEISHLEFANEESSDDEDDTIFDMDPFEYSSALSSPFSSSTFDSSSFPSSPKSLASVGSPREHLVELEEAGEEASLLGDALLQEVAAAWESGGEKSVHAWIVGRFAQLVTLWVAGSSNLEISLEDRQAAGEAQSLACSELLVFFQCELRIPRIHLLPLVRRLRLAFSWLLETGSEPGMDEW